jgi:hypothetical protein
MGRAIFSMFAPFGWLFSAFNAAKHDIFVHIKLPICDSCRRQKVRPEVQSYDLEDREIRLVVHERFREMVAD